MNLETMTKKIHDLEEMYLNAKADSETKIEKLHNKILKLENVNRIKQIHRKGKACS